MGGRHRAPLAMAGSKISYFFNQPGRESHNRDDMSSGAGLLPGSKLQACYIQSCQQPGHTAPVHYHWSVLLMLPVRAATESAAFTRAPPPPPGQTSAGQQAQS
jgi:hypothetical protein